MRHIRGCFCCSILMHSVISKVTFEYRKHGFGFGFHEIRVLRSGMGFQVFKQKYGDRTVTIAAENRNSWCGTQFFSVSSTTLIAKTASVFEKSV